MAQVQQGLVQSCRRLDLVTSSVSWNFSWEPNRPFGWKAKCLQVTKHKVQSTVTQHLQTTMIWLTENLHRQFGSKWSGSWTDWQRITIFLFLPLFICCLVFGRICSNLIGCQDTVNKADIDNQTQQWSPFSHFRPPPDFCHLLIKICQTL